MGPVCSDKHVHRELWEQMQRRQVLTLPDPTRMLTGWWALEF